MVSYHEVPASPLLARFVRCFWFLKGDGAESVSAPQKILPDGCMEIVIHLGRPLRRIHYDAPRTQPRAFLVGQLTECFLLEDVSPANVMGIRFKPAGAAAFVPFDLNEIQNDEVALEDLWGPAGRSLLDAVINANSDEQRIQWVERFLLEHLGSDGIPSRIDAAVRMIESSQGKVTVPELSERVGWSPRQLERQFASKVGVGPKTLIRTIRFQSLLRLATSDSPPEWASLALYCGFFDQAHLIHEFKRFSGEAPEVFLGRNYMLYEFFALYQATLDPSRKANPASAEGYRYP